MQNNKKFAMACAICQFNFENLLYALCGVSDEVYTEVRDNILHNAREILRQQPEDPLAAPRRPLRPRRAFGYRKALIYKSRLSGKVVRVKALL